MSFETIQEFYQLGMWSATDLIKLVGAGVITAEEFTEITGQAYPEPVKVVPAIKETPVKEVPVASTPAPTKEIPVQPTKSLLD